MHSKFVRRSLYAVSFVGIGAGLMVACGKKSSAASEEYLSYLSRGFAVASPVAATSSTLNLNSGGFRPAAEISSDAPIAEKAAVIEALGEGSSLAACSFSLPNMGNLGSRASCYGPQVVYDSGTHPDGGDVGDRTLPGGDLGIWNYAQAPSGEACAVAQLNSVSGAASAYVDASLLLQAASICVLNNAGKSFPAVGGSAEYASELSAALAGPSGATISSASVTRSADSTLNFTIEGTTAASKTFKVNISHSATGAEETYSGIIYGTFLTNNKDAFSVEYSRIASALKVRMLAGNFSSNAADNSIFSSVNRVNAGAAFQSSMNHAILNYDVSSKTGSMSYAWQAGSGDRKTRVFNVYVDLTSNTRSGCGFFGFGPKFSNDVAVNTNAIEGMICNWAGPGNNPNTMATGKAQKQCFAEDDGKFLVTLAKNKVRYWPTNNCEKGGIGLTPAQEGSASETLNDLTALASDSDFSSYTAPQAP